jgi:RimJ/RimL family protein N-acetyltransferase
MIIEDNLILENDFVQLRPLQIADYDNLIDFSINEPYIWKYGLQTAAGAKNLKKYLQTAIDNTAKGTEFPFIVFDKKANSYAGSTRFYDINLGLKTIQLGYTWYGTAFQGTALNKNCKYLLLQYCFEVLQLERVEFRADTNNQRSIAAMKSIGCQVEGILRNNMPILDSNLRRNSIVLSILKNEWHTTVKPNLLQKLAIY